MRTLFVERRDEPLKLGQWKGPEGFHKWLMQLATKVLKCEGDSAVTQMPEVGSLFALVC